MANLFKKAAPTAEPKKATKKSTKKEFVLDGLETLSQLDYVIKAATGIKASVEGPIKTAAMDIFMEEAKANSKRPDNFTGYERTATASVEMRKRATSSALSAAEIEMLAKFGITLEQVITTQKLFGVNPKYAEDESLLEKVSKAIEGIVPDDFFVIQEEQSKMVVSDKALDEAFSKKAPREVIETLTTMALKPKLFNPDVEKILNDLKDVISSAENNDQQQ